MSLTVLWGSFVFLISYSEEVSQYYYFFLSGLMFWLTYLNNQIWSVNISMKTALILLTVPSLILWYIAFVYNDFLAIRPISFELLLAIFFIHSYLTLYFIFNSEFK